jgi:hypothetical protein
MTVRADHITLADLFCQLPCSYTPTGPNVEALASSYVVKVHDVPWVLAFTVHARARLGINDGLSCPEVLLLTVGGGVLPHHLYSR